MKYYCNCYNPSLIVESRLIESKFYLKTLDRHNAVININVNNIRIKYLRKSNVQYILRCSIYENIIKISTTDKSILCSFIDDCEIACSISINCIKIFGRSINGCWMRSNSNSNYDKSSFITIPAKCYIE